MSFMVTPLKKLMNKGFQQNYVPVILSTSDNKRLFRYYPRTMSSTNTVNLENLRVEHDSKNKKFFIKINETEAKLEYVEQKNKTGDMILNMWHTEVPPNLQGKGIAKILAKEAFDYVVENNMKMRLSCSYLQKYLTDNPLDKYKSATV